jgi:hypothetical protein
VARLVEGVTEDIPAGLVLRSVGYKSPDTWSAAGLPWDDRRGVLPSGPGPCCFLSCCCSLVLVLLLLLLLLLFLLLLLLLLLLLFFFCCCCCCYCWCCSSSSLPSPSMRCGETVR